MCGFLGIAGLPGRDVAPELYEGLIALQHRGQDAAGILSFDGMFHLRKQNGMVRDIFRYSDMQRLKGNLSIGHVRYPTVGMGAEEDAQPFYINFPFGVAMAHNGNLTNWVDLRKSKFPDDNIVLESSCDVEAILYAFAQGMQRTLRSDLLVRAVSGQTTDNIVSVSTDQRWTNTTAAVSTVACRAAGILCLAGKRRLSHIGSSGCATTILSRHTDGRKRFNTVRNRCALFVGLGKCGNRKR